MSHKEHLVENVVDYVRLIHEAKSSSVATWTTTFVEECTDRCLHVETELALLSREQRQSLLTMVQQKTDLVVPPLSELLDAFHSFYYTLIQNVYTSNPLYLFIIQRYRFLTTPDQDTLTKDLTFLAQKATLDSFLLDMMHELNS